MNGADRFLSEIDGLRRELAAARLRSRGPRAFVCPQCGFKGHAGLFRDAVWIVLVYFRGEVVPKPEINRLARILLQWPEQDYDPIIDRSIDVHVSALRKTLLRGQRIEGMRGKGYKLHV